MTRREEADAKLVEIATQRRDLAGYIWVGKTPICRVWCVLLQLPTSACPQVLAS